MAENTFEYTVKVFLGDEERVSINCRDKEMMEWTLETMKRDWPEFYTKREQKKLRYVVTPYQGEPMRVFGEEIKSQQP